MKELSAILAIAYRDLLKFLRDPPRMVSTFIFPLVFIGILGGTLQAGFGASAGYNLLVFTFTGVLAQTLFMSAAQGVISLIDDRENDFSQEIFVSPISRYSIIFGKILGESLVALPQGLVIVIFGVVLGVPLGMPQLLGLVVTAIAVCLFGGAFGVMVLSSFNTRRAADQLFPFIMLPQFFTAGVFAPLKDLPFYLDILSRISPMRYAVDLLRSLYYVGQNDYAFVVLASPLTNMAIAGLLFAVFLAIGTWLFVRRETNR